MKQSRRFGIAAALLAAFAWSLNFAVPFAIGPYSVFDFALLRFGLSGLAGLGFLALKRKAGRPFTLSDWLTAARLAFIGYVGYFLMVTGAALLAGPVIAPAILGLVPIVLALAGNFRQGSVPWRSLAPPLSLVAIGLILVNWSAFAVPPGTGPAPALPVGLLLAVGAVALWVWFALANEAALAARPGMPSTAWTALTLAGGGLEMLAFLPVGLAMGLFEFPRLGFGWQVAAPLYAWGALLAILGSVGGVWAWTIATRELPVALAAQLIVSETVFGAVFGLAAHGRWPAPAEAGGILALIAGVVAAIRAFHSARPSSASARKVRPGSPPSPK